MLNQIKECEISSNSDFSRSLVAEDASAQNIKDAESQTSGEINSGAIARDKPQSNTSDTTTATSNPGNQNEEEGQFSIDFEQIIDNQLSTIHNKFKNSELKRVESNQFKLVHSIASLKKTSKELGNTSIKFIHNGNVIIISKPGESHIISLTRELVIWMLTTTFSSTKVPFTAYIQQQTYESKRFNLPKILLRYPKLEGRIKTWTPEMIAPSEGMFDFAITLGGDGTLLYTSWLFQRCVPLVIPFQLGSLGFLASFDIKNAKKTLKNAINHGTFVSLRSRFNVSVFRRTKPQKNDSFSKESGTESQDLQPTSDGIGLSSDNTTTKDKSDDTIVLLQTLKPSGHLTNPKTSVNLKELDDVVLPNEPTNLSSRRSHSTRKLTNHSKHNRSQILNPQNKLLKPIIPTEQLELAYKKPNMIHVDDNDCLNMVLGTVSLPRYTEEQSFRVLNEVVVDRGSNPFLTVLELYADNNHLTTVQADGLVLSTPTGSTAYSLAAGGSLVHPEIPAILVTPICPHTLSFRPMLLPDSMVLKVQVPLDSRNTAWVSFDGRNRLELHKGDYIQLSVSNSPLPTMSRSCNKSFDWIESIERSLNWNVRQRQKEFKPTNGTLGGDSIAAKTDDNSELSSDEHADDEL